MERRQFVAGIATAGLTASVGGCLGSVTQQQRDPNTESDPDESPTADGTGAEPTETGTDESTEAGLAGGPEEAVAAYLDAWKAEDREALAKAAHSESPLNPETHADDAALESVSFADYETRLIETGISRERVTDVRYVEAAYDDGTLGDVLGGHIAALVRVEVSGGTDGGIEPETDWVVVTEADNWRVFWRAPATLEESDLAIDAQVVETVSFEDGSARVDFQDVAGFERATVETERNEQTTVDAPDQATVPVDSDGDAVVVTATVDGETAEVHRERYPPDERFVEAVRFDAETAQADVRFGGETDASSVHVDSVNTFSEASSDTLGALTHLTVGFDPQGDEIVVTVTTDGEDTVVHRERHSR